MSWAAVARKDFHDAVQSRTIWALSGFFILLAIGLTYAYAEVPLLSGGQGTIGGLVFFLAGIVGTFVAVTTVVLCYRSIAGEAELGSMKLLLSLPHSRSDVVLGKVIGRTGVLALPLSIGLGIGLAMSILLIGRGSVQPAIVFLLWTFVFALAYVSIIVGLSALTGSTTRAAALSIGFFLLFEFLWDAVPFAVLFVVSGFSFPTSQPDWYPLLGQLSPSDAYVSGLTALLPDVARGTGQPIPGSGVDAFYADPAAGIVILFAWLCIPLAIGYTAFSRADL